MHEAAELVADSAVAVVHDAGHSAYFEKPTEYNTLVLGFIERRVYPR